MPWKSPSVKVFWGQVKPFDNQLPKLPSSMNPGNEDLYGNVANGKVQGPGGVEFPVGTPSITGQFDGAVPGQIRPGGPTGFRIHGPGLSLGCITTGMCGHIQDVMEDNAQLGGMELEITDVCCKPGESPPEPSL